VPGVARPEDSAEPGAAHPRNRTGRQRTSPRTASERRTLRTRNVTYAINIVTALPEAA